MTSTTNQKDQNMDPVQKAMGAIGWWHIWVCGVVFLLKFPVAWHQMAIIFLAPPIDSKCAVPANASICSAECKQYSYDRRIFTETITTEWDLVCDSQYLAHLSQTIFMLGILLGNVLFGSWSDKFGRRNPLVVAVIIQLITGVGSAFAPWFWLFCILKFITGFATGGTMVTSFVLVMELIGAKWRELVSVLYQIPFNVGHLTLAAFGYYLRDWRWFQFGISIPSVVLISYYWLVPESPRWLFTTGQIEESAQVLRKAAKQNGLPTENIEVELEKAAALKQKENIDKVVEKGNALDLVRTSNMCSKTVFICFNWLVCGLYFFGVAQYIGHIGGNIFWNVAIGAGLEIPGTLICIVMMKYWGRKKSLIISNTLSGIAMLGIAFVSADDESTMITLSSIGIVAMSISFPNVYVFAGELFPTVIRNVGVGIASMIARIGSMLAPFVVGLGAANHALPPIIFGVVPLLGAIMVLWLPETMGQPLPETIEDAENFGKKTKGVKDRVLASGV
ncbi:organic cation transporter protein-like isoform X2 [Hermetia illucens]|uniref:organic cation transporter protein-like isoform X2 n=1 Tax=Hermetia illucens TaxID=343691 RepID=UPI0018CC2C67|nr:organic cation transporter protein-like isoform X2 [Hermetia illucens]